MKKFEFSSKAATLNELRSTLSKSHIAPSIVFSLHQWAKDPMAILDSIHDQFDRERCIVRSSAMNEDSAESSLAGQYRSYLNIPANSKSELSKAIQNVINSYSKTSDSTHLNHEVFVQPMIKHVLMSGVVFTRDIDTGGPYYVINYDDVSGKTDAVTSGALDTSRSLIIHKKFEHHLRSHRFQTLLESIHELESLIPDVALDIEFAMTKSEEVYVLQVRPLATQKNWNSKITEEVHQEVQHIKDTLGKSLQKHPSLLGHQSVYGVMPDWNPVEMIGSIPKELARSLYEYLITNSTWAEARASMGYKDVPNQPLMSNFGGHVYIDVRKSFNSYIPAELNNNIAQKLIDEWLITLKNHPELHDKVEFEVASTIYSLDFTNRYRDRYIRAGLSDSEIKEYQDKLKNLTLSIIDPKQNILKNELSRIKQLRNIKIAHEPKLSQLEYLLQKCIDLGTRPFSILARCAFIGEEMLRSLIRLKHISQEQANEFKHAIPTVLSDFIKSVQQYQSNQITQSQFLKEYGHLRPGTYDICSSRYDSLSDYYAVDSNHDIKTDNSPTSPFIWPDKTLSLIDQYLLANHYPLKALELLDFIKNSIQAREYAKLQFTRLISDILEMISTWGQAHDLNREALSQANINQLLRVANNHESVNQLKASIENQKHIYCVYKAIRLPFLIQEIEDVDIVPLLKNRPNFVTDKVVEAPVVHISSQNMNAEALRGAVVLIESADPGFDWIFLHAIKGLITQYGGANSHMAIRCAELSIPAAIGCGEQLFNQLVHSKGVSLDCSIEHLAPIT